VAILGVGGALGITAIQLARSVDAHVIGTDRAGVKSAILEAGADRFVDLEQEQWKKAVGQVDLVYDLIGGDVRTSAQ